MVSHCVFITLSLCCFVAVLSPHLIGSTWPQIQVPYININMSNSRIVVMTGATGSIGQAIATGLAAQQPTTLILALRNLDKGKQIQHAVQHSTGNNDVHLEHVELDSSQSIADLCKRVTAKYGYINVLMNDAAIAPKSKEYTKDNIEMQFGVNVYAYYLLSEFLLPALIQGTKSPYGSRIVNVASNYAGYMNIDDLQFDKRRYNENQAYQQSKQADRILSWQLAEKYKQHNVNVYSCHPGVVTSTLLSSLGMSSGYDTAEQDAATPIYVANDKSLANKTGVWLDKRKEAQCKFRNDSSGKQLMEYLESLRKKAKL